MSPLLRRLGVTRRRSRVDLERALEVAETDRDIARAEKASAYEALGKVAVAAGRPGAPTRWNVEDLVQWVAAAEKVEDQRDTLGAELVAVDEALAEVAAGPRDDRAAVIRDLADRRTQDAREHFGQAADALVETLGLTPCVRDGCGHARHQHAGAGECHGVLAGTRGAPCRCEAFDDGVVDARIADARSLETGGGLVCGACGTPYPCPEHQPDALAAARADADPWCSADLDGASCARLAGHTEPCRPIAEGL